MKIPRDKCPADFFQRPQDFADSLYVGRITEWTETNYSLGELETLLGESGSVEARTQGLLVANNIEASPFDEQVLGCLPKLPFTIPNSEIERRRDFRQNCVFTIDPSTARDLDDALSVEDLGSGRYRIAVHIADVSYFVRENSKLDESAAKRATSVYLVQTVIPMLPRELCENLCSLNPDEDRLAFSVEWVLDEDGNVEEGSEWFGRSVIRSCCKLSYEHAQEMLDRPEAASELELPDISAPWTADDLSGRVNALQKVAVSLRKARVERGALRLDQPKVAFKMDRDTGMPIVSRKIVLILNNL